MPPFLVSRRHIAMKVEAVEGTPEALADADVIAPAFGIEYAAVIESFEREVVQASFSRITQISGEQSVTVSFSTELKGASALGVAPANLSVPLLGCGIAETIVASTSVAYDPASSGHKSLTIEIRESDGGSAVRSMKIAGARGTFTIEATKGDIVLVSFEFTGKYIEPTDGATQFVSSSLGVLPEPFLAAGFTFQGVGTLKVQAVSLDIANNVILRNDVNDATGNLAAFIVGRSPTASIDPEVEALATINFYNKVTTNAEGVLEYVIGSAGGNRVKVTAPKAQIIGPPSEADRDNLRTVGLDLQLNQSLVAGDDEFQIFID